MFDLNKIMNKIKNKPQFNHLGYIVDDYYNEGDVLVNVYTGQVAILTKFMLDPFAIVDPEWVVYVEGERDDMDSGFNDYWHNHQVALYKYSESEV